MNVSETQAYDATVVCPKSIAPLRLLRVGGHGGRWPVRWHVVYPDGEINPLVWTTRRDAMGQAAFAVPYHAAGTRRCAMWAVRTTEGILAVFDTRLDAEDYAREWRSLHGERCSVVRTEN